MMDKPIFIFLCYKAFLQEYITQTAPKMKGVQRRISEALGCQPAYLSQVLNQQAHLSMEQTALLAKFLQLNADETEYLMWLVEWARAGNDVCKQFFSQQLEKKREQMLHLKKQVRIDADLADHQKAQYYSHHLYAAIHILSTIPRYSSIEKIAERLKIDVKMVTTIVDFLVSIGLLEKNKNKIKPTSAYLFLDKQSPFITQHHTNWRLHAIKQMAVMSEQDLHLSMVVSMSEQDRVTLYQRFTQLIAEVSTCVKESAEEELIAFNLDFFKV